MLRDTPCKAERTLGRWGLGGIFTCIRGDACEHGTFHATFRFHRNSWEGYTYFSDSGNFRRRGNLFADITPIVPEADIIQKLANMTAEGFSDFATGDVHFHSVSSKPPYF